MLQHHFQPGDLVVYRKQKHSTHPGPRARNVSPAPHGELYTYLVEKFWIVAARRGEHELVLMTRRGKEHVVDGRDGNLRPARFWERLFFRNRFPKLTEPAEEVHGAASDIATNS